MKQEKLDQLYAIPTSGKNQVLFDPISLRIYLRQGNKQDNIGRFSKPAPKKKRNNSHHNIKKQLFELKRPILSRLTLHISNTCNLGCGYCYASGGNYGLNKSIMKSEDALRIVSNAVSSFDIKNLMFFGGEPSLNYKVVLDTCLFLEQLYKKGFLQTMPKLGVITNFYGMERSYNTFLAICKKFEIQLTGSIDGPPEIHNSNRPTLTGNGSFKLVKANFLKAKNFGIDVNIECTYTPKHIEHGISVLDLMKFFDKEFGVKETHIAPVSCSSISNDKLIIEQMISSYCEAIEYMVKTRGTKHFLSISLGEQLLNAITSQESVGNYCPAGNQELTIGPNGNVWPCFMFVGHEEFNMGQLNTEQWLSQRGEEILKSISRNGKDYHPICRTCWAKKLCSGCIGSDYLETGNLHIKPNCAFVMATSAEAIKRVVEQCMSLSNGYLGYNHRSMYVKSNYNSLIQTKEAVNG